MTSRHTLPTWLDRAHHADAVAALRRYFDKPERPVTSESAAPASLPLPAYSGARFDTFDRRCGEADVITASDLLSLSLLSVDVSGQAIVGITDVHAEQISNLLAQIPVDTSLHELDAAEFTRLLGPGSPAQQLWEVLKASPRDRRWGMGPTRVSKLMARKRPRLIPIWDTFIETALRLTNSADHWIVMHKLLQEGDLVEHLQHLRDEAGLDPAVISELRVFDVVVWMQQRASVTAAE